MGYEECFTPGREPFSQNPKFFKVVLSGGTEFSGSALAVAENVLPSMDNVFTGRNGNQLALAWSEILKKMLLPFVGLIGEAERNFLF